MKLLDVQELDSRADRLRHQLAHLPEHAEIQQLTATRADLDDRARDVAIVVEDLTAEQAKVDADVEQVKTRRTFRSWSTEDFDALIRVLERRT